MRAEQTLRRASDYVVDHPTQVIVVCLVLTAVFAPGMARLSTEAGTSQFTDGVPEADALEAVEDEFDPRFSADEPTTQLIQTGDNVLDRRGLLIMLETTERVEQRDNLRVASSRSAASAVAQELDSEAETAAKQRAAIEDATDAEIRQAIQALGDDPGFESLVGTEFNAEAAEATASLGVLTHEFPREGGDTTAVQRQVQTIAERTDGDITVFGSGILDDEFQNVVFDSLSIVVPVTLVVILGLLAVAYRDPFDFALGGFALLLAVVWTFGFTGWAGIPFSDMLVAVPVLLLAIGIDFGIHTVNRYREERMAGEDPAEAMRAATGQLVVAYSIITGTTVIGFLANLVSDLGPIQEFGIVAGVGIIFTLAIFGAFLPAAKLTVDRWRADNGIPSFGETPLGAEGSTLGEFLPRTRQLWGNAPVVFLLVVLLVTGGAASYGAGVDTTFDDEDFLPPEEQAAYISYFPEPMQPAEYTVAATLDLLSERFETAEGDTVTIYIEDRMTDGHAIASMARAERDPPDSFVERDGRARTDSIVDPIDALREDDEAFAERVAANSIGAPVPNRNLEGIYSDLRASRYEGFTNEYLSEDNRATRVVYQVESDATDQQITADARAVAERYRGEAVATGQIVVFQAVADTIFQSALLSLAAALGLSSIFLVALYGLLVGRASLGLVTLFPVLVAVCLLTATMRLLAIPFNALTGTILAITIGLGVDYAVHVSHRFYDEYEATGDPQRAVDIMLRGTGGALTGTMATTALGIGVLVLAITPILGEFGRLTALSITYAYLASILVLPAALVVWVRVVDEDDTRQPTATEVATDGGGQTESP